jgi:hypothetical protein
MAVLVGVGGLFHKTQPEVEILHQYHQRLLKEIVAGQEQTFLGAEAVLLVAPELLLGIAQ